MIYQDTNLPKCRILRFLEPWIPREACPLPLHLLYNQLKTFKVKFCSGPAHDTGQQSRR